jgi:hypothetical protein
MKRRERHHSFHYWLFLQVPILQLVFDYPSSEQCLNNRFLLYIAIPDH